MNSVELIRRLSLEGAENFYTVMPWINPIPKSAEEILEKMEIARQRLQYAAERQGAIEDTDSERALISRLKTEIEAIIGANK
ncbi:hypothetical protein SAMN03080615_02527 [Amphritea atlantica]|uniref:Uncharacterized protein n=1 Tax=Amphritea atlantica TaxID=355243 RepID=A0A1H9IFZ1_9GAMM|nr:hypothetical protein [Amphritea atlantica]SEQ73315.1 hypothetical protein SAMN03080615_02527 [Amphritea atlantica]